MIWSAAATADPATTAVSSLGMLVIEQLVVLW